MLCKALIAGSLLFLGVLGEEDSYLCLFNKSLPAHQPNVYLCPLTSFCCNTRRTPACCERDLKLINVLEQVIPFAVAYVVCAVLAGVVNWYYWDPDSNEENDATDFKKKLAVSEILFPEAEVKVVDDPVFGRIRAEKAPKYSTRGTAEESVGYVDGDAADYKEEE